MRLCANLVEAMPHTIWKNFHHNPNSQPHLEGHDFSGTVESFCIMHPNTQIHAHTHITQMHRHSCIHTHTCTQHKSSTVCHGAPDFDQSPSTHPWLKVWMVWMEKVGKLICSHFFLFSPFSRCTHFHSQNKMSNRFI